MTVMYLTEYNTRCYGVTFQNNGSIRVQRYQDISDDENKLFCIKPSEIFLGRSKICDITIMSGASDKSMFDGSTILPKISGENDKHRYIYIGGVMICSFLTNDIFYRHISNLGNNLTPYSIAVGHENIYFLTLGFEFIEKKR